MHQKGHGTVKLPRQLLEELGGSGEEYGRNPKKRTGKSSRKEQRKAARVQKKSNHIQRDQIRSSTQRLSHDQRKRPPKYSAVVQRPKVLATSVHTKAPKSILKVPKSTLSTKQTSNNSSSPPTPKISRAVQDHLAADDAEIAAWEKKLGMKGKKKLPKSFEDDGLDSLLDSIDDTEDLDEKPLGKRKRSEEEQWLYNKRQKAQAGIPPDIGSETSEGSENDGDLLGSELQGSSEDDDDEVDERPDPDEIDGSDMINEDDDRQVSSTNKKSRENPYVAPSTSEPVKYIPPSLRNGDGTESQDLSHLKRQLQGLLNRLSEANILTILGDVEKIYRNNPRQHASTTLLDLLMGLLADPTILSDTFIILHAGFIAAMYKVIGSEFGAQAIQRIDEEFEQSYSAKLDEDLIGKKMTNLVSLLADLYVFQVIGSNLIYDLIRLFLEDLSETNTELLMKIIRNAGPQLRQDDPLSLKDIVHQVPASVAKVGEGNLSVRAKVMIKTIYELKDNRMKNGKSATTITSELIVRMKKTLGSLNTRSLKASEPLRIGMQDLRDRDKVGSWWLVGASYKGEGREMYRPDESSEQSQVNPFKDNDREEIDIAPNYLAQLAREQRMNTDVRRSIFVAIMSSSDHRDAYGRLMGLRLKGKQEEQIPKVIVHCAGAEKLYNPFYTFLSRRLCSDKDLRYSFQVSLWNLFNRMGEGGNGFDRHREAEGDEKLELRSLVNLARMFGVLVAEHGLGIDSLKVLDFATLQPQSQMFLEVFIITVILHCLEKSKDKRNKKALLDIFLRPKEISDMAPGLQYFLKKMLKRTDLTDSDSDKKTVKWACRITCDALTALKKKLVVDE